MGPLAGKAIVITGAGRGIGAACARTCAALGAAVVVNDADAASAHARAAEIAAAGGRALPFPADVTDWDGAGRLVDACVDAFGAIDGLVNNAGLFALGRLDEAQPGVLERLLAVNVVGTFNCAAHAVKPMLAQGTGSIVNITSGAHMGIPAMSAYAASKGAVTSLMFTWAIELAGSGVRANCVSPLAATPMFDQLDAYHGTKREEAGRPMTVPPEANAGAIAFLLSDAAAGVNGQTLRVEGDLLSLMAHPGVLLPLRQRAAGWDYEAIRDIFAEEFAARQQPLGVMGVEIAAHRPASAFWAQERGDTA
ncbi:SDR family NAD(P)-dependent oxidoreductase [uncultured Sphingomonas sp.]|uniref:SDR family NAD(P)-dependent oxidoreductase n=1 Tax=uncultured Sphingomonas sp. TaxID=158754 RepID=UPI0035CAE7DF